MRTHTDLELFAEKCWATDSEDRNGKPMKELITNGCDMEKSLTIMDAVTPIKTRFFFDAFRYQLGVSICIRAFDRIIIIREYEDLVRLLLI